MSNYFDNQSKWSWDISEKGVFVTTDHGNHTHTLEVTNVPVEEMVDNTGKVMGEAHRAASHDFKETNELTELETEVAVGVGTENDANMDVSGEIIEDSTIDSESIDGGEDCEDGLDI